jgi:hypothetical protein
MVTLDISRCEKSFDFKPLKLLGPHLPALAIEVCGTPQLLAGFTRMSGEAVLVEGRLTDLLFEIYGKLSLPELARLVPLIRNCESFTEFLQKQNIFWNADTETTFKILSESDLKFQNWVSEKQMGLKEIHVLQLKKHIEDKVSWDRLIKMLPEIGASRSQGVQILEWAGELLGQGVNSTQVFKDSDSPERWLHHLKILRYPMASHEDSKNESRIKSLPWPSQCQAKWVRQGDQSGIEVRFQVFSDRDLEAKLKGLGIVKEGLRKDIWTSN